MLNSSVAPTLNYSEVPLIRCSYTRENGGCVFLFLIPSNVVRGFVEEIESARFEYLGYQWKLRVIRSKVHIGAFVHLLALRPSTNFELRVDLALTILNKEHFSKNQDYFRPKILFTRFNDKHGCKTLIELSGLCADGFLFDDNSFLLEVEFTNPRLDIALQLHSTSELLRFLRNTYVDRYDADDSEHGPILFVSEAFNAGGTSCHLGLSMTHASVFGQGKEDDKISLYTFHRRKQGSQNGKLERHFSFIEFACEFGTHFSKRRMQFIVDSISGMSSMVNLNQDEANAVTSLVREQIGTHIAKKVPFKHFNVVLNVKLNSVRLRHLIPKTLLPLHPKSRLFCARVLCERGNATCDVYAYLSDLDLVFDLQVEAKSHKPPAHTNYVDLLWWRVYSNCGDINDLGALTDDSTVALSATTALRRFHGNEDCLSSLDVEHLDAVFRDALSPSQCFIKMAGNNLHKQASRIGLVTLKIDCFEH
ncbi:unnamed protein product [Mesocestoides corti]|uniref:MATH domain-containing protein n=1 Tax=Mesocestoides corti TaxID=53468 RepID=A0A0R3UA48_MESCO|nr:unnamed protein product [Mesocestoides corti]